MSKGELEVEVEVLAAIAAAIGRLGDDQARKQRVLAWVNDALRDDNAMRSERQIQDQPNLPPGHRGTPRTGPDTFHTIGELIDAAQPSTRYERILATCYWAQQGELDFTGASINDALKDQGHGVPNITDALSKLIRRQPALVRQVRKEGKTKQARKRYALTDAGRRVVTDLLAGRHSEIAQDE
jgi:hypothetical protein